MPPSKSSAALETERSVRGGGDPWQGFAYVVSGVVLYGLGGWLLDRWWGTSLMVVVGILVGAGLGIYMTFGRFGQVRPAGEASTGSPAKAPGAAPAPSGSPRREQH